MKYINLLLTLTCILLLSCSILSGVDEEGEKMIDFVKRIVDDPERMPVNIEKSEYYDKKYTKLVDSNYLHVYINNIKSYKKKGIQYHYVPDSKINKLDRSQLRGKSIFISSGNVLYSHNTHFFFQYIKDKWVLINISIGH